MSTETKNDYRQLIEEQRNFFFSNTTKDVAFRKKQLKTFKRILQENESALYKGVYDDFRKTEFETFETELALLYDELNLAIEKVEYWSARKSVPQNLFNLPGKSYIQPEPLGVSLIIGAWNYPYLLSLHPLISALAAGNTVILKPSELASYASKEMARLINGTFAQEYCHVIEGGIPETTELLQHKFDKIFYTGSTNVGKIIARAAAEHLTPVTLELGGKSPAFIWTDKKMDVIAKRIVWGKYLNCGQTCVAPDYILIKDAYKEEFMDAIRRHTRAIYGENPKENEAFPRIINERHYDRLAALIDDNKVVMGGERDKSDLYIAPTMMDNVKWEDKVMQEEIFGPILPVLSYTSLEDAIRDVKMRPKPLALYVFTSKDKVSKQIFNEISFGGGVQNETITHLANHNLPFGGVGNSGHGNYHGKFGFDAFSHTKSIMTKPLWFEPNIKYPPFTDGKFKMLRWLLK